MRFTKIHLCASSSRVSPAAALLLPLARGAELRAAGTRQGFDLYLESQGVSKADWEGLAPQRQQELVNQYLETLQEEGKTDESAVSLLKRLKNPP